MLDVTGLAAGYGAPTCCAASTSAVTPARSSPCSAANGVGKSTLNNTLSGLLRPSAGTIRFDGVEIARVKPAAIVARGPDPGAGGPAHLSEPEVRENLELGSYRRGSRASRAESRARVRDLPAPARAHATNVPVRCPAASSRCWRSAAA